MNPRHLEIALKKQRLQFRAEMQRENMMRRLEGFESVLDIADTVREQFRWARENAPLLSAGLLILVLRKPRRAFRLARRAWLGWAIYRRGAGIIEPLLTQFRRARGRAAPS
jgi:hypothetical protein